MRIHTNEPTQLPRLGKIELLPYFMAKYKRSKGLDGLNAIMNKELV